MAEYDMFPSPIQDDFIESTTLENCIMSPRGEGKTEAGIMAMTIHATRQERKYRPIPWAILRDTWTNLERTTLQSFLNPRPGSFAASIRPRLEVKDGGRKLSLPGYWDAWLFGVDTVADLNRFQSMQLGGMWFEEVAPAAMEEIGSGISEDTWLVGITSLRHPVTTGRRAQITMNYPDEDHWSWIRFHEQGQGSLFRIPRGENKHIDDDYRNNMAAALRNKPSMLARLVEGRPAQVTLGEAVTPEYKPDFHRSPVNLNPLKGVKVIRCWDGGLNPTCVFCQLTPRGRLFILDTLRGVNMGLTQLIESQVIPLITTRYKDIEHWQDMGDPAMNERESSDSTSIASAPINKLLSASFEAGESSWTARREAIKELLGRNVDGEAMLYLSKHEGILHRALNGGWHYHKDHTGQVLRDKPVKDLHSHPADALTHMVAKIFRIQPKEIVLPKHKNLAKSYVVGMGA